MRKWLVGGLSMLGIGGGEGAAETPGAGTNAAQVYRRAAALLPGDIRERMQRALTDQPPVGPMSDGQRALTAALEPAAEAAAMGAVLERCEFEAPSDGDPFNALADRFNELSHLGIALGLSAREALERGDVDRAVGRLESLLSLARGLSAQGWMLSSSLSASHCNYARALTANALDRELLDRAARRRLLEAWDRWGEEDIFGFRGALEAEGERVAVWMERGGSGASGGLEGAPHGRGGQLAAGQVTPQQAPLARRFYKELLRAWDAPDEAALDALYARAERGEFGAAVEIVMPAIQTPRHYSRQGMELTRDLKARLRGDDRAR